MRLRRCPPLECDGCDLRREALDGLGLDLSVVSRALGQLQQLLVDVCRIQRAPTRVPPHQVLVDAPEGDRSPSPAPRPPRP